MARTASSSGFRFAEDYERRLLALPARITKSGGALEGTVGPKRGGRLEFRDARPYVEGDDPRDLDWNAWMRLEQLVTKEYAKEEAPEVLVVLDRSASMGAAGSAKDRIAREVAGGLAHSALAAGCRTTLAIASEGGPVTLGTWRSPRKLSLLLACIEGLGWPDGPTHLHTLHHLKSAPATGRIAFILSDFLVDPLPAPLAVALAKGSGGGTLLHLLTEDERHPKLIEGAKVTDPETGQQLKVQQAKALMAAYREEIAHLEASLSALARRHLLRSVSISDGEGFERSVLRAWGLL